MSCCLQPRRSDILWAGGVRFRAGRRSDNRDARVHAQRRPARCLLACQVARAWASLLPVCWHARLQEHGPHFSRPLPAHSARVRQVLVGRQRLGWMSAIERWHSKPFASGVFSRVPRLFAPLPRWSTPAVVPAIRHTHRKASRASLREHPLASGCLLRWRSMIA